MQVHCTVVCKLYLKFSINKKNLFYPTHDLLWRVQLHFSKQNPACVYNFCCTLVEYMEIKLIIRSNFELVALSKYFPVVMNKTHVGVHCMGDKGKST